MLLRCPARGSTLMLPTEDAAGVGEELRRRFGLPFWQIATTATDANRFALRVARAVTNRPKILVFNGCYHGAVEDTFVRLKDGLVLDQAMIDKIKQKVRANTTPRHVPAKVVQVTDIPRTKSNKIVELAVRNIVHGLPIRNIEALANPEALEQFRDREELKT